MKFQPGDNVMVGNKRCVVVRPAALRDSYVVRAPIGDVSVAGMENREFLVSAACMRKIKD